MKRIQKKLSSLSLMPTTRTTGFTMTEAMGSGRDAYVAFVAEENERKTVKVDVRPDIKPENARTLFYEVMTFCGFAPVTRVNEQVLLANVVNKNKTLGVDEAFEFVVVQELSIRNYGQGSAQYASLALSWQAAPPRLLEIPKSSAALSSSTTSFLRSLSRSTARREAEARQRKAVDRFVDEMVERWRAMIFQKEYALESSLLDNSPGNPWQSLSPEEVDYDDLSDEEDGARQQGGRHASYRGQESWSGTKTVLSLDALQSVDGNKQDSRESVAVLSHRLSSMRTSSLHRPKSALKLNSCASGVAHGKPLKRLQFSQVEIVPLDISIEMRESRMALGCQATDAFGEERPLTNTRTGDLVFYDKSAEKDDKLSPWMPKNKFGSFKLSPHRPPPLSSEQRRDSPTRANPRFRRHFSLESMSSAASSSAGEMNQLVVA